MKRHARAGVEDVDDELIEMPAREHLVARRDDRVRLSGVEPACLRVRERCCAFDTHERTDERREGTIAADRIVLDRSLGLRPPQSVGGNLYLAQRVTLAAEGALAPKRHCQSVQ